MTLAAVVATCTRLVVKVLLVARSILKPLSLPLLSFHVRLIWRVDVVGRVAASVDGAAGMARPEPVTLKVYGLVTASLLAIEMVAVRVPAALGLKHTVKVEVLPAATVAAGCTVTEKSAALVPLITAYGLPVSVSLAAPALLMVKT